MLGNNEITQLLKKAMSGSVAAYDVLFKENRAAAKRANTRMKALESKGFDYYAYDNAVAYTERQYGTKRFTTSRMKLENPEDLALQLRTVNRFLNSESSTITGQKDIKARRLQAFADIGIHISPDYQDEFLRFLGNGSVQGMFKDVYGNSSYIAELINQKFSVNTRPTEFLVSDLQSRFGRYMTGEIKYDELMDYLEHDDSGKKIKTDVRGSVRKERKKKK